MMKFEIIQDQSLFDVECAEILKRAMRHAFGATRPEVCETVDALSVFASRGRQRLVARTTEGIVGFLDYLDTQISFLMVDPAHHRHGVGSRLAGEAITAIGERAWLLCSKDNTGALAFYKHKGFRICGERRGRMFGGLFDNHVLVRG